MLGAAGEIRRVIKNVSVDAAVSRQVSAGISVLTSYRNSGKLGNVVVIQLGNNGTFTSRQFDQIMAVAGESRKVVFLTLKVPRPWETPNNSVIRTGVQRHPNAVLVDWRGAGMTHPDYFGRDGIHLTGAGARAYTQLIASAIGR
jgi:hypothetical protein